MTKKREHYDVVIVGAGPIGLMCANLLGLYRVKTLLIEKEKHPYEYPRGVSIDDESLRTLQLIGFSKQEIAEMFPVSKIEYLMKQTGYKVFEPDLDFKPFGYPLMCAFLQPEFERRLRENLAQFPSISFVPNCKYKSFRNLNNGNISVELGEAAEKTECRFLLACDGGSSQIRADCGVALEGSTAKQRWLVIDLEDSDTLRNRIAEYKKSPFGSIARLLTVRLPKNLRRFEAQLDDSQDYGDSPDEETVREIFKDYLAGTRPKIIRARIYSRHTRVSNRFRTGNVFLVGDAAHLVPPYGGQGLCSGIRDALNLCWKIDLCLKQVASDDLLDSYEIERRSHIFQVISFVEELTQVEKSNPSALPETLSTAFYRKIKPLPNYRNGTTIYSRYAGELLVQPEISAKGPEKELLDYQLGNSFSIIGLGCSAKKLLSKESLRICEELKVRFLELNAMEKTEEGEVAIFTAEAAFPYHDVDFLIVRPDRHIMATCQARELNETLTRVKSKLRDSRVPSKASRSRKG